MERYSLKGYLFIAVGLQAYGEKNAKKKESERLPLIVW